MVYLLPGKNGFGYPNLQNTPCDGYLEFPDRFLSEYYKEGKRAAGFVKITDDGTAVTSCVWDEEAYQKWAEANPEQPPVEPEATDTEVLNTLLGVTE